MSWLEAPPGNPVGRYIHDSIVAAARARDAITLAQACAALGAR